MSTTTIKKFLLLDGFGAIVSAVLLGIILVKLEKHFGIPRNTLYLLAALPCLFSLYDFYSYFFVKKNLGSFLRVIAIANLLYCCLSLALAFHHREVLTTLGWAYIIVEIIIVTALALIELKVAKKD